MSVITDIVIRKKKILLYHEVLEAARMLNPS
jgi:hypothetical protein